MNHTDPQTSIESRLRHEASQLYQNHALSPSAAELLAKHRRRRRACVLGRAALATAAVVFVMAHLARAPQGTTTSSLPAKPDQAARQVETPRAAPSSRKPTTPQKSLVVTPRESAVLASAKEITSVSLTGPGPFLILAPSEDGKRITTCLYFPETVERVHFSDLDLTEQAAVNRILSADLADTVTDPL